MKTKYYLLKALHSFKKNFLKYLSITAMTIAVLLVFYVISTCILVANDFFNSLYGYIIFIIAAVVLCLLLNPILEAYVFAIDVTKDHEIKGTSGKQMEYIPYNTSYMKSFIFGIKHKLRMQNRGSVKVLKNIIRSVLIYLFLLLVSQLITLLVFYFINESAYELYYGFLFGSRGFTEEEFLALTTYLNDPLLISNFICLLISFLSYFYFLFIYLFKSSLGNSYYMILKSNRVANINETYKENRTIFIKPYLVIASVILVLFSVAFTLCYFLLYYLGPIDNLVVITETSLFIGILFILLFIPAVLELFKSLKITFNVYFMMSFISYIQMYINNLSNDSLDSYYDKERAEFIKKLYKNDLTQVLSFGNLYYLQLKIEYDLFKTYPDFVDEEEINRITTFMTTNEVFKQEGVVKEEIK